MKNYTTPRTLAECQFHVGHRAIEHPAHRASLTDRVYGVLLAIGIGAGLAMALVQWWGVA